MGSTDIIPVIGVVAVIGIGLVMFKDQIRSFVDNLRGGGGGPGPIGKNDILGQLLTPVGTPTSATPSTGLTLEQQKAQGLSEIGIPLSSVKPSNKPLNPNVSPLINQEAEKQKLAKLQSKAQPKSKPLYGWGTIGSAAYAYPGRIVKTHNLRN